MDFQNDSYKKGEPGELLHRAYEKEKGITKFLCLCI